MTAKPAASQRGGCQPRSYSGLNHVVDMSALYDPARAMLRFKPKASPSWRPTNHCPIATVMATIIDSAPNPKMRRPAAITGKSGDMAVTAAPIAQMMANTSVASRVPNRSTIMPPRSTMMMLGKL